MKIPSESFFGFFESLQRMDVFAAVTFVIENNGKVTSNCDLQNSSTCDSSSNS